jgi:hypothetical protein
MRLALVFASALVVSGASCAHPPRPTGITRQGAVETARQQVSFRPDDVDARSTTSGTRRVWRVTLRGRLPGQPPGLFETAIVDIDHVTGAVVSLVRN